MTNRIATRIAGAAAAVAVASAGAMGLALPATAADGDLVVLPDVTTGPFSWTEPSDSGSGIVEVTASGLATGGSMQLGGFCAELPIADIRLIARTAWTSEYAPTPYENPRAGSAVRVVAQTAGGDVTAWSWTTPPEDASITTRDELAPHVADVGLAPSEGAPTVARWSSEIFSSDGTTSTTPGRGTARAYVQSDPTDPAPPAGAGAPATWHVDAVIELPSDTTSARLELERLDGTVESVQSAVPVLTDCGLDLQDQVITVPVGQSASVDLLTGAQIRPEAVGTEALAATAALDVAPAGLGLSQTGATVTATPTEPGTVIIPVTGTATGSARTLTGSATLTVTAVPAAATPTVDLQDQTVELTVGETATIDLLTGASATGVSVDDLLVYATTADPVSLRDGMGWVRAGRTATVLPTTAGTWTVMVEGYSPDYSAWDTATLTLVVTDAVTPVEPEPVDPPVVEPEPQPEPVAPQPQPEPAPATAPVAVPIRSIETDLTASELADESPRSQLAAAQRDERLWTLAHAAATGGLVPVAVWLLLGGGALILARRVLRLRAR